MSFDEFWSKKKVKKLKNNRKIQKKDKKKINSLKLN